MAAASSIGEAIALQRTGRGDYWLRRLADDMRLAAAEKAKKKEKEAEELATLMDFKIDYSKYLPAYAKKLTEKYADMINNVAKLRQDDPNVSHYALKREILRAKDEMNSYVIGNQTAMDYLKNDKIMKNNDFVTALRNSESTLESLSEMSNPGFYVISPTGSFNYRVVPSEMQKIEWGQPTIEKPTGQSTMVSGTKFIEFQEDYDPQTVAAVKQRAKDNPVLQMQTLFDLSRMNPEYRQKIDQGEDDVSYAQRMEPIVTAAIDEYAEKQKPGGKLKYERGYQATGGRGVTPKKKNYRLMDGTMNARSATTGKPIKIKTKEKPLYSPQDIIVESNGSYINYGDFTQIPSTHKNKNISFSFKPNKLIIFNDRGEFKRYVRGNIVKSDTGEQSSLYEILGIKPEDREKWMEARSVLIPYEEVESLVEYHNVMDDVNEFIGSRFEGEEQIDIEEFQ
jgi:hypothetical protein